MRLVVLLCHCYCYAEAFHEVFFCSSISIVNSSTLLCKFLFSSMIMLSAVDGSSAVAVSRCRFSRTFLPSDSTLASRLCPSTATSSIPSESPFYFFLTVICGIGAQTSISLFLFFEASLYLSSNKILCNVLKHHNHSAL